MMLEIIKMVPEVDMVVQKTLRTVFQSMKSATLTLDTVEGKTTKYTSRPLLRQSLGMSSSRIVTFYFSSAQY